MLSLGGRQLSDLLPAKIDHAHDRALLSHQISSLPAASRSRGQSFVPTTAEEWLDELKETFKLRQSCEIYTIYL